MKIEIIVSPEGETRVETKGFAGSSCRDVSRFLEEALGRKVGEQVTAEFYQTAAAQRTGQQHLGAAAGPP